METLEVMQCAGVSEYSIFKLYWYYWARPSSAQQTTLVLSAQQTMPGKLDKCDLLEQKLQKVQAMKNISLMLIIYGVLGFPDGVF